MNNNLTALEEFDVQRKIEMPHLLHKANSLIAKKNIAYVVLAKKEDEILLISPSGFGEASVATGLNEKDIEYFARRASREHKENLYSLIANELLIKNIWDIAKAMDEDFAEGSKNNQQRVKNVLRYIYDNQLVFHF